jgi:hypothetical protein
MFTVYHDEERGRMADSKPKDRASVEVLQECIDLQRLKGQDYQSSASRIKQADYYPSGIRTIREIIHAKLLRAESVEESIAAGGKENFESLEDSYKDLINYASFAVAYLRGQIDGQSIYDNDFLNRPVTKAKQDGSGK